ncbi:FHA domain-containing protein [Paraflavitalea soli]|nr:FHA domain-containing protein [Paraflavitalea soli]
MKRRPGDFLGAMKNWLIPESTKDSPAAPITNNDILKELLDCFDDSCKTESVGASLVFNMHFLVILHPDVYEQRLPSFPVVVKEAVKMFYKKLEVYRKDYEDLSPVSSHWQFRFGPASDFNSERISPYDIKIIGMLTGIKTGSMSGERRHTAKVTMKSKATNVFDKMDINLEVLRHIHFAESGNFTVKFSSDLSLGGGSLLRQARNMDSGLARIEYFMGDKNKSDTYLMKDTEIVIARKEPENQGYSNYLLIESSYVSNPHARIRLNEATGKFQIASFSSNETRVNEVVIARSEAHSPRWFDLEPQSQVLLNGIITLEFKQQQQ